MILFKYSARFTDLTQQPNLIYFHPLLLRLMWRKPLDLFLRQVGPSQGKLWIRLWVKENATKWLNSADRADVSWASSGRQPKTGKHYGSLTWHPVALACNAGPSDQNIAWLKLPPLLKGVVALPLNSIFKGTMTFTGISTLIMTKKMTSRVMGWLWFVGFLGYRKCSIWLPSGVSAGRVRHN